MSPIMRGMGGRIACSGDPVGVSIGILVGIGIASCLHSISLMNGWILARLTQIYHGVGKRLDFDDLDLIFKVT